MLPRDLLIELERRQSELHKVAASMPVEPYYVRGYQRAVADLRQFIEAHEATTNAEKVD